MSDSFWRIARVLGIGVVVFLIVVASIWLAQADVLMTSRSPRDTYALPTPTLFPTSAQATGAATSEASAQASPTMSATGQPTSSPTTALEPTLTPTLCAPAADWIPYTVQAGDTYAELADLTGTNVQGLLAGNCLEAAVELQAGSTLYLPAAVAEATPKPVVPTAVVVTCWPRADWPVITVQQGDTLYALSVRYGTSVAELMRANCLANDLVKVGEQLRVPGPIVYPTLPPTVVWPTPTFTPLPTSTPQPTLTPTPADTPTATSVPSPTPTPTETPVLVPTWTPPPTGPLPTPTSTAPTPTPAPTATPAPSATPPPTATVEANLDP